MNNGAIAIDPKLRAAALEAIASSAANARANLQIEADIEKRYNSAHLLKLAQGVSLNDIAVTLRSAAMREKGLERLRAGDMGLGARLLVAARDLYKREELCREAFQSAVSFQFAAEAYLHYKRMSYQRAEALLLHSIAACEILHDEFGHDIEVRRVHLAANIVRVRRSAGSHSASFELATALVAYLYEAAARWPLSHHVSVNRLDSREIRGLADQILDAAFAVNSPAAKLASQEFERAFAKFGQALSLPQAIVSWLRSQDQLSRDEVEGAIIHAIAFFGDNQGLPRLTRRLRSQVESILHTENALLVAGS